MLLRYPQLNMAPTASATVALPTLTQSGARIALQAAEQHAIDVGVPMCDPSFPRHMTVVDLPVLTTKLGA